MEDIPWGPSPEPTIRTAPKRKCSHPRPARVVTADSTGIINSSCGRCGHVFDPDRVKRGRRASRRGKDGERRVKAIAGGERTGQFGGAEDNRNVLGAWTVQTKSGTSYWPKTLARLLDNERLAAAAIGSAGPAVCYVQTGHRGAVRNRVIFACDLDDLARWIAEKDQP